VPRWVQIVVFAVVIGIVAFFAFGLRQRAALQPESGPAPEFTLNTFDGQQIKLASLRGKVVVINFWASWCVPCRDEAAFLEKTWKQYKDRDIVFLGVDWVDPEPDARKYIKEFGITYTVGPDLGTVIGPLYRIKGVPETYFVGKDGTLAGNALGPITKDSGYMTERAFVQKLEQLLAVK
jgi:cytochrome c biogenesis protein CcmG, thiol:disulfide interchange protein DsbE